MSQDPILEPLARDLFIAFLAATKNISIEEAASLYEALIQMREDRRPGHYWHCAALLVQQQMDDAERGIEVISLHEDRLADNYQENDPFPRYLFSAYAAFRQHTTLLLYSLSVDGVDNAMEIGDYWRWLAQKIKREFSLDTDVTDQTESSSKPPRIHVGLI